MSIRLPGQTERRGSDYHWVNVDTVPTLLELAGAEPMDCHGQSVAAILTGKGHDPKRDYVISQYYGKQTWVNPIRSIRTAKWKYNLYTDWGEELYDLENDPEEIVNLSRDPNLAQQKTRLKKQLDQWINDHGDPFYSYQTTPLKRNEAKTILKG